MRTAALRARAWVSGNSRATAAAAALLALGSGCGGSPEPVAEAMPYADPGFVEAGGLRLHYALTPARALPAGIAGSYGVEPRRNLAVLTVVLAPRDPGAGATIAEPRVEAEAVSLTGIRQRLALTRRDEPGGATWTAPVEMRHRVPVTIEIRARASAEAPELSARLTREFRFD